MGMVLENFTSDGINVCLIHHMPRHCNTTVHEIISSAFFLPTSIFHHKQLTKISEPEFVAGIHHYGILYLPSFPVSIFFKRVFLKLRLRSDSSDQTSTLLCSYHKYQYLLRMNTLNLTEICKLM